jgi:phage replication-related protein YjqB (UPF0714/DUF867 family)
MAPHGGWIEPYTSELAEALAGEDLSFYTFRGIKDDSSHTLHLTSHRFDEPVAMGAASAASVVVAIHGERSRDKAFVMVGGAHAELKRGLRRALAEAGFQVKAPREGLGGENPRNICNRGSSGGGVQLEVSEGLRWKLRTEDHLQDRFVRTIRRVLLPEKDP